MNTPQSSGTAAGFSGAIRNFFTSPYLLATMAMFFWAASTIVARGLRDDIPPMGLSFWRTFFGFLVLLVFMLPAARTQWPIIRANWRILLSLGFLLIVGGNAVLFLALQFTIAINAAVINSVEPLMIIVIAWLLYRDPVSVRQMIGVAISFFGVLTLIGQGSVGTILAFDFNTGDILVIAAYLSWAFYAVQLRRAPLGLSHNVVLLVILGGGSLCLFPFYVVEATFFRPTHFDLITVVTVVALALLNSILSVMFWNRAITSLGSGRAGLFIHLIAVFTVIMAILFLGEELRPFHGIGIALVAAGIILANIRRRARQTGDEHG